MTRQASGAKPKGPFVYVVGADGKAAMRTVEIDSTEGAVTLIASGLEEGEQVVLDGQNQLRPGSKVQAGGGDKPKMGRGADGGVR